MSYDRVYIFVLALVNLQLAFGNNSCLGLDYYYWRDYIGVIPPDAFPGGTDKNGKTLYIAEGYHHNEGLYITSISPGAKDVDFPCHGVKTISTDIRILCTKYPENLTWVRATKQNYERDTRNFTVIRAGYDKPSPVSVLRIGRTVLDGRTYIGQLGNGNKLWYAYKKEERTVESYEILVAMEPSINPRIFDEK